MGTGWSEENRGWQYPTFHCPSFHYGDKSPARLSNALPGPAHTLTSVCAKCRLCCVETVLVCAPVHVCNCVCVCGCVHGRKYVCMSVCINPGVCVWVSMCVCAVCMHVFLHSGRNSWLQKEVSHCQQEHRLACLSAKNKAVCSLLELHSGLATQRRNVHSVLTQHVHCAGICNETEAVGAKLKHVSILN